jgi:programmed cell death protein 5
MSELEELRKRKIQQMQMMQQSSNQKQLEQEIQRQEVEKQINLIIHNIMTPEARQRLANIRLSRPEYSRQVELLLIQLAQSGNLPQRIDDETFKRLLSKISGTRRKTSIKRK